MTVAGGSMLSPHASADSTNPAIAVLVTTATRNELRIVLASSATSTDGLARVRQLSWHKHESCCPTGSRAVCSTGDAGTQRRTLAPYSGATTRTIVAGSHMRPWSRDRWTPQTASPRLEWDSYVPIRHPVKLK